MHAQVVAICKVEDVAEGTVSTHMSDAALVFVHLHHL